MPDFAGAPPVFCAIPKIPISRLSFLFPAIGEKRAGREPFPAFFVSGLCSADVWGSFLRRLKAGDFVCKIGVLGENNFMKSRFCAIFTAAAFAVCVFFPSFSTAAEEVSVDSVNAAFGIKMFSEGGIWKDKPLDFGSQARVQIHGSKAGRENARVRRRRKNSHSRRKGGAV